VIGATAAGCSACETSRVSDPDFTYDDARQWIAKHRKSGGRVSRSLLTNARALGTRALPAMVEIVAAGRDDEKIIAMQVLALNGATSRRVGDTPQTAFLRFTLPDGTYRDVLHGTYPAEDFDADRT